MAQTNPGIKKLKIQTGVVKRLTKEKASYEKEIASFQQKMEKMKTEGSSQTTINREGLLKEESETTLQCVVRKLKTAMEELPALMAGDLAETEEYKAAQTVLEAAKAAMTEQSTSDAAKQSTSDAAK